MNKMKIAYNSAYVQTETLNFTLARQAVIVYFVPNSKKLLCWTPKWNINVQRIIFCE